MTQMNSKGMDSAFIKLAQEQLDGVNRRLAEIEKILMELHDERAMLRRQRANLQALVNPSTETNGARNGKVDVQATRDAVVDLLQQRGLPMHFREDLHPSLMQAGHEIGGKDPANTLLSRIFDDERLRRVAPGTYGLVEWDAPSSSVVSPAPKPTTGRAKAVKAAQKVLRDAGQPLHPDEIAKRMLKAGLWESSGRTPGATVGARIYEDIQMNGDRSPFIKVRRGVFGLRDRDEADD